MFLFCHVSDGADAAIRGATKGELAMASQKTSADNEVVHVTTYHDRYSPYSTFAGSRRAEVTLGDGRTGWDNGSSDSSAISGAIRHARSK